MNENERIKFKRKLTNLEGPIFYGKFHFVEFQQKIIRKLAKI